MSDSSNELLPSGPEPAGNTDSFWKRCARSLRQARDAVGNLFAFKTNPLRALVVAGVCLAVLFVIVWIADKIFTYFLARSYVQQVADVFDLNKHLANAIVYVTFVAMVFLGGLTLSLSRQRRLVGIFGIIGLLIGHSLVLWWGTSKEIISREGAALKCYVITRDGVRYGERAGIDPGTGRQCRAVTPEMVERLREYEKGNRPKLIADGTPTFFNQGTGEPIVWHFKNKSGEIELFDLMGFHPNSGEELVPVTRDVVDAWKNQKQQEARQPPQPIDPEKYAFFDPITGKARVWYRRAESDDFEFYNREGFHPRTGEALTAVSREVIEAWQQQKRDRESQKCYIITRDAVRFGSKPGIDTTTGRECRLVTTEILERLREYEKGNRPKPIKSSPDPTFFDLRTGEPIVWYYKAKNGSIEIFDLMGFHPDSGEELLPITREVVEIWKTQQKSASVRAPQRIDPEKYAFFDPVTGSARVWFWRSDKGEYEFYDAPGYQPRTGDSLAVVTKDALEQLRRDGQAREKQLEEERQKIEREKRERTEKLERETREIAKKQEEEARIREAERKRETQAANLCDQMAGNPSDPGRSGIGVTFDVLKNQAKEAIANCEQAVRQYPNEVRFQYQLGRSLQFVDRNKAFDMLRKLVGLRYPAAYDNFGWMLYADKKNVPEAVSVFRLGTRLGDPDSMVSLAEMIDRGHATPADQNETKIALYARAAALGHQAAQRALQVEQAKEAKAAQDLAMQQQQQRLMLEVLGTVIQNVRR
jgi:TPR repeat protein